MRQLGLREEDGGTFFKLFISIDTAYGSFSAELPPTTAQASCLSIIKASRDNCVTATCRLQSPYCDREACWCLVRMRARILRLITDRRCTTVVGWGCCCRHFVGRQSGKYKIDGVHLQRFHMSPVSSQRDEEGGKWEKARGRRERVRSRNDCRCSAWSGGQQGKTCGGDVTDHSFKAAVVVVAVQ